MRGALRVACVVRGACLSRSPARVAAGGGSACRVSGERGGRAAGRPHTLRSMQQLSTADFVRELKSVRSRRYHTNV